MGQELFVYELKDRIKFYQKAIEGMIKGTEKRVALSEVYSVACQGLITSVVQAWPDLILYITGQYIPNWVTGLIRQRFPHIKQAVWYTESPYMIAYEIQRAPSYDYVFTCDKSCEEIYKRFNPQSYYLPTAYNSNFEWKRTKELRRWEKIIYQPDVFFVGSEVPGRLEFLKELISYIKGKALLKLFGVFPSIEQGLAPELEPFYVPVALTKFEVIKYYNNAKITLNHFRENESKSFLLDAKTRQPLLDAEGKQIVKDLPPYSISPRVYEIMAAGGFLLTSKRPEIDDLFVDGEDLVTFEDAKDCAEKILEYLDREEERKRIAENGQKKIEKHTYVNRMERMLEIISGR